MLKRIGAAAVMAAILLAGSGAMSMELLVCILDKNIGENYVLPGGTFALPETKLRCSQGVGSRDDTFEASLQKLYKGNWRIAEIMREKVKDQSYSIYYLEK